MKKKLIAAMLIMQWEMIQECSSLNIKSLPNPYNQLTEILPLKAHGWYLNAQWMAKLFACNKIKTVVEVGSWLGASTSHMAFMLPEDGILYAIDTWLGSLENINGPTEIQEMIPTLYEQFLSNMIHCGLVDKIIPIRSDSVQAAKNLHEISDSFDLIYIDGAHDTLSVFNDLTAYFPFVSGNKGILCGDDWDCQDVRKAVWLFAQLHNLSVYGSYNFWFIREDGEYSWNYFTDADESVWKILK